MKCGDSGDFPIDLSKFKQQSFDISQKKLSRKDLKILQANINLCRDAIIFFTALAGAKGLGGHSGGPYDIVPEVLIFDAFMHQKKNKVLPILFDAAGHRVAIQYLMAVLKGDMRASRLLHYRDHGCGLYGHPEREKRLGIKFSSGRLGHLWSYVNGVALANPDHKVVIFSSDGSMQEGGEDEAAKFAVAHHLNIKISIDYNDVTISGHPSEYMYGYHIDDMLKGHGLSVSSGNPEELQHLYQRIRAALLHDGPVALVNKRKMAPDIHGLEDNPKAHDVIKLPNAIHYLSRRGYEDAAHMLIKAKPIHTKVDLLGSSIDTKKNRVEFGDAINNQLKKIPKALRPHKVCVIDSDLQGSTGLSKIAEKYPEVFIQGGIMERNNFSVAAGFGMQKGRQGIMSTFSAFSEMLISELTMARLNKSNMLCHFSHAGVEWMADNNCHYGVNNFFLDNGFWHDDTTRLYYPADAYQMHNVIDKIFTMPGIRFVFSTRSPTPMILDEKGKPFYKGKKFVPGKDDVVRKGKHGFIVTYGEMVSRAVHVSEKLKEDKLLIGVINKTTLNVIDELMMDKLLKAPFILLIESQNEKTGLGVRFGTWLLERGYKGEYVHLGTHKLGTGGIVEHLAWQGLGTHAIMRQIRNLAHDVKR